MIGKLKGLIDGFGDDHVHIDVGGHMYTSSRRISRES